MDAAEFVTVAPAMGREEDSVRATRSFRNDDAELRPLSEWFREFARASGLSQPRTLDFELCLNELVTNVINYAYADRGWHEIRVFLEHAAGEVRATVEDDGRPFNPLEKEAPRVPESLEEAAIGGWGIPIVRALAGRVVYERSGGRNRLTIAFRAND
jgi:anti-sigma regulatory factor (Ser/Thr protein kinase)